MDSLEVTPDRFISDLDRCKHGRHQFDPCFSCPDGQSTGNAYLFAEGVDEVPIGISFRPPGVYVLRRRPNLESSPVVVRCVNRETGEVTEHDLLDRSK